MNMMDGFQRRRELKKKGILEAALELFMEHGVQKVSISEIAKKADVSQVTIYNYFGSKDQLAYDTVMYYTENVWHAQKQILINPSIPYTEKLKSIIFDKKQIVTKINNEFHDFIMQIYATDENFNRLYNEELIPHTLALFEEGKKLGYVDKNFSNEVILMYLQMFRIFSQNTSAEQILPYTEELMKLFLYGLSGEKK